MISRPGNLFKQDCNAIVIPTTGWVDSDHISKVIEPIALRAAEKWKGLERTIGHSILRYGSTVQTLTIGTLKSTLTNEEVPYHILTFPTRPGKVYVSDGWEEVTLRYRTQEDVNWVPGWQGRANLSIIKHSLEELVFTAKDMGFKKVCLPKLATGEGGIRWSIVNKLLEDMLDDRFYLIY